MQIGKKWAYFSPNWLKIYKIAKKRLNIFHLRRAPPQYNRFNLGKKYISGRGGKQINFKFNIHPALHTRIYKERKESSLNFYKTLTFVLIKDFLVFQPGGTVGWSSNHLIFILLYTTIVYFSKLFRYSDFTLMSGCEGDPLTMSTKLGL